MTYPLTGAELRRPGILPKIAICVCTYRRPQMLADLIARLQKQETRGQFTFSIRVVDNDKEGSAREAILACRQNSPIKVEYLNEPFQNISRARNRAVRDLDVDYIAMIDDDEIPAGNWLWLLFEQIASTGMDAVLGPVLPLYPPGCPAWLKRSGLCERRTCRTGTHLNYGDTRTGNVLLRASLFIGEAEPFNVQFGFGGGEDIDFFRRKSASGGRFAWCNEAEAWERVTEERWKLSYYVRRQFRLGGLLGERQKTATQFIRSLILTIAHGIQVLGLLAYGKHRYSKPLVRFGYHLGYLGAAVGLRWERNREEAISSTEVEKAAREWQRVNT